MAAVVMNSTGHTEAKVYFITYPLVQCGTAEIDLCVDSTWGLMGLYR